MNNHLKRLEIDGYRGFDHLVLDDLADVNLIVGKNNVGKTSLFESLVLLGSPALISLSLAINEARGLKKLGADTKETYEYHFNKAHAESLITLRGVGIEGDERELTIRIGQGTELFSERRDTPPSPQVSALLQQDVVRFDYTRSPDERAWAMVAVADGKEQVVDSSKLPTAYVIPFSSAGRWYGGAHQQFTQVSKKGMQGDLLRAVRAIAPEIDDLQLLTYGGEPNLFARPHGGNLMPLQLFGGGVGSVTRWALSLLLARNSLIAIDEFENGIHHSVLKNVWHALIQTAREHGTQIVATTHSFEAVSALHQAYKELRKNRPSIKVIRLQKVDREIRVIPYDEEVLGAAIGGRIEVR